MAALPGTDWTNEAPAARAPLGTVRHVFTHFSLDLAVDVRPEPFGEGWWQPIPSLETAGLPTLYRNAARQVLRGRQSLAA
jgi:A/G-specific adenine glycosylase